MSHNLGTGLRWFARGAWPTPWVFSNLHAMALEGWARRHPWLALLLAEGFLGGGLWRLPLIAPVVVLSAYLLALGLWQLATRPFSRALGLQVLVVVPTAGGWMRRLVERVALPWPATAQASVVDLHVDAQVRFADPEALFAALDADCSRLAELWDAGHLGGEVVVVANTFNKQMLAIMAARLGPRGATSGRRGCLLQRESADAHSKEFVERVQRQMFGRVLPGARARNTPEQWDLLLIHLRPT